MALKGNWIDKTDGVDVNSAEDINQVAHAVIDLENSASNITSVDDTLTVAGAAADAKAVGDRLAEQQEQIDNKQPIGDYALKNEIPVQSVNGKTGAVQLAAADVGAAAENHNQAASTITAGTLAGKVNANATAAATVGTAQVRDIYAGTADMAAGSSTLTTGTVYFVYE